jgi:DNA ligase D-like protein (predicted 3'-phosphoesterase)
VPGKTSLLEYRKKRDFRSTREPRGKKSRSKGKQRFVIQKHGASSLHYDFRLEVGGVLKSWAVPKGPSTDPRDKRLAVSTEDHPLDYAGFEGVIPEGEYGAGSVIVWDAGTYRNLSPNDAMDKQIEEGHVSFWLDGQKLHGGYVLQRIAEGKKERWLLIKMDDDAADARRKPVKTEPRSVLSERTVKEVAKKEKEKSTQRKK